MRTLKFILSATAILFLTSCDEESPTSSNPENNLRRINVINLNDNSISKAADIYKVIYDCKFSNNSTLVYSTEYTDGYTHKNKLVINHFIEPANYYQYNSSGHINGFSVYPDLNTIFFSADKSLYKLDGYGDSVIRLTHNLDAWEESPLYSPDRSILVYSNINWVSNCSAIMSLNLNTNEVDTLVNSQEFNRFTPLFFDEDSNRLIYSELTVYSEGWIKSINLFDTRDIRVLTDKISRMIVGQNMSLNDKIVFSSDERIYTLNINTSETNFIATGLYADISNDGDKVVFCTRSELFLINSDGTNRQRLVSKTLEKKYLFLPSFSSNNEQIVFIESNLPYGEQ